MTKSIDKPTIYVTRRWPEQAEAALYQHFAPTFNMTDEAISQATLVDVLTAYDGIASWSSDRIDAGVIAAASGGRAKIIANFGVGVDHIDVTAARAAGIAVTNTPGVLTDATADLTMTLMLMTMRRTGDGERLLRAGQWRGGKPTQMMGRSLQGKTLGIIGMGRIAQAVARRAVLGFDMEVVFWNRSPVTSITGYHARQLDDVDSVCAAADILSLHCAATPDTRHIVNADRLALMRPDAMIINTARGDVIDEKALIAALVDGRIGGAGLDVFQGEPHIDPALLTAPHTVFLPHMGSTTREARTAMGMKAVDNLVAFFAGKPVLDPAP